MRIENNLKKVIKALSKGHTLIAGQTQYGKSTAAAYFFTQKIFPGSSIHIFMDTKHDDSLIEHGQVSRTMDEFRQNLILGYTRLIHRPPSDEKNDHLDKIVKLLFSFKDDRPQIRGFKRHGFMLFIDEIQLYASRGGKNAALQRLATTGLGKKIIMVAIGQRIQSINNEVYTQCNNTICFFMKENPSYLKGQNMGNFTDILPWLRENPYHFAYEVAGDDILRIHAPVPLPGQPDVQVSLDI